MKDIDVYAFVGPSGTGKSYRAQMVASENNINYIIDDGLLISAASTGLTKNQLAKAHLCTFVKRISQIPNTGRVYWNICLEDPTSAVNKPVLTGSTVQCNGNSSSTSTVLKVIWEQEVEDSARYTSSGLTLNAAGTAVLYSYQAPISR